MEQFRKINRRKFVKYVSGSMATSFVPLLGNSGNGIELIYTKLS